MSKTPPCPPPLLSFYSTVKWEAKGMKAEGSKSGKGREACRSSCGRRRAQKSGAEQFSRPLSPLCRDTTVAGSLAPSPKQLRLAFSALLLTFGTGLFSVVGCSVHCRKLRSIPGLYPLDARGTPQDRNTYNKQNLL